MDISTLDAQESNRLFQNAIATDGDRLDSEPWLMRWLFADLQISRGQLRDLNLYEYEGVGHLRKLYSSLSGFAFVDYFSSEKTDPLAAVSAARDLACTAKLGIEIPEAWIRKVARYNAQDYLLQHPYAVPERQSVRALLDFGAGHGRIANLAFGAPKAPTELYIAVDAIPATYLSQRAYFHGLGLRTADYIDILGRSELFDSNELRKSNDVLHIPTWRLDLVPNASVDMVCCIQVLKELPRRLIPFVIPELGRVLKPGGALYIRDHVQLHDPAQMPIDELVTASGFSLEFRPHIRDRIELHGLPRIWRKIDPSLYLRPSD